MARQKSKVTRVLMAVPLAPFADAYTSRLGELGYTPLTVVNELRQIAHLSRWLEAAELTAHDLASERVGQFLAERSAGGHGPCSAQGLVPLVDVLVELAILAPEPTTVPSSPNEPLLAAFSRYLLAERGLAESTAERYVGFARRFLDTAGVDDLAELNAGDVTVAVQRESERVSAGSAKYFVAGLRAFLRFGFIEGLVGVDLSAAAPAMIGHRRSLLPKAISHRDVAALLASCDRRRSDGRRDYAIVVTLARLGLRASEVAGLTLDDIDWRAGEMVVRGKGHRLDRLPVPVDVGEAIVGYLQRGRPDTGRREVFLRSFAPVGSLGRGGVSSVVRRACRRAGIVPVGAHRLRHTLGSEMLSAGAGLSEIGQVLRHRSESSTSIYARVDVETLRGLALPWPGEK